MKINKIISTVLALILTLIVCFSTNAAFAQAKMDPSMMKDCCMKQDGKMMQIKDGKTMSMDTAMTMKNGTKCMPSGECMMKNGKKMMMKDGQCMDMSGKMDKCSMMKKNVKTSAEKKS